MSLLRANRIRTFFSFRPSNALAIVRLLPVGKLPTNSRYCWSPRIRLSASALNLTILDQDFLFVPTQQCFGNSEVVAGGEAADKFPILLEPQDQIIGVGVELDDLGVRTAWCPDRQS